MPEYSLSELYPSQSDAASATATQANASSAATGQAANPDSFSSTDATASHATNVDAAAASGSAANASSIDAESVGYNAQTGVVDPGTMTAAGQLDTITGRDSPLMRRAAREGLLAAHRRGMGESSIAAGNAMGAMVDRAAPIAQQDANTHYQNMRGNLDSLNRAREISTGRETDVSMENARMGTNVNISNASEANRMEMLNTQLATDVAMANAKAENDIAALNAQLETAVNQQNAQEANRIRMQIAELQTQVDTRNAELETQTNIANADAATRADMLNAEMATNVAMQNAQEQNRMTLEVQGMINELNKQYMVGEQNIDLAHIQGQYQELIASNQAASQMYGNFLSGLSQILSNDSISSTRASSYVRIMTGQLTSGLEFIDSINALDVGLGTDEVPDVPTVPAVPQTTPDPTTTDPTTTDPTTGDPGDAGVQPVGTLTDFVQIPGMQVDSTGTYFYNGQAINEQERQQLLSTLGYFGSNNGYLR